MYPAARAILLTLLLASVASSTACIQCNAQTRKEQTSFCEAGAPDELLPTPMPQTVITAVMNSNEGRQAQADASAKHIKLDPAKLLNGTTVQLSNSASRIFIVMGNQPLSGGDNTWFWIVQDSGQKATVLLWAGANCFNIESTKTHGYRDILVEWSSAAVTKTEIYKFDGSTYKEHSTHWHENKP